MFLQGISFQRSRAYRPTAQHQGAAKDGGGENINIILISESAHFPSGYLR